MRRPVPLAFAALLGACSPKNEGFQPPVDPASLRAEERRSDGDGSLARAARAPKVSPDQVGLATWYGAALAGRKTASGERFDPSRYTAAHRSLPFGTWVEVRRPETGRSVRVRITDRGPFGDRRRVIDLSRRAAEDLGIVREGVARVELRIVEGP